MKQESDMLKAFLANQKYTDQEASDILIEREAEQQQRVKDAYAQLGRSQKISDYMEVETNIKPGELDQKTQPPPSSKATIIV